MVFQFQDGLGGWLKVSFIKRRPVDAKSAAQIIIKSLKNGGKVFTAGNGGSCTQALHFSGELIGKFEHDRRSLPAICLCADIGAITAIGNDFGFEYIFSRQLEGLGKKGDVLVTFSTSGKSPNVLQALKTALEMGIEVIETPRFPNAGTAYTQEVHSRWIHDTCREIEKAFL